MKFVIILLFVVKVSSQNCPCEFKIPEKCFEFSEISEYGKIAVSLEELNLKYLDLLSDAHFLIDANEVGNIVFHTILLIATVKTLV